MPRVVRTIAVAARPERMLELILDFAGYPRFLREIHSAVVHHTGVGAGAGWTVQFQAEVVRALTYTLRLWREPDLPDGTLIVRWSLVEGPLFKANEGSWRLRPTDDGRGTSATYELMVELAVFVPTSLVTTLTDSNLTATLEAFKTAAEAHA